ncbi:ExbD/TolR family protein [Paraliomyxa miuraensis]|uniref:ExbD/TolR family protein n=1 Tax=Paraliomyxa miuraensis TaxID=376150 RepID=UPI002254FACE|nr:biopolymer transporter ExbD [Paraliomyxa miuraensis]MCX4245679.1 biopolymer transporter ExbD [Paraliomyxa miuraensis]
MGMSAGGSGGGAKSEINVTPLVDVCLVLLIIFMVMVPRKVPEISVRVPPESKQKQQQKLQQETLVVGLNKEGGLTLNRNPIDRTKLAEEISRQLEVREKKVVFVDFDDDAKFGVAVEILDLAKQSGAEVLGIMKNKDKKVPDSLRG